MSNNQNIIRDFVLLWRASPLTTVPIYPPNKVPPSSVPGSIGFPYATITCAAGEKEFNSSGGSIQDYFVEILIYDASTRGNHTAYQTYMANLYNFGQYSMFYSAPVLIILPEAEELLESDDENIASGISISVTRWIVRCQQ